MATKIIFCFWFLVFVTGLQAQSIFSNTYGGNGYDTGNDVIQIDSDSSFYITGSSSSPDDAPSQALLLHVDQFGGFIASYFFGGTRSDIGVRVMHKPGVGFWIAGYSNSFSADGNFDFYLIKLNEQYEVIWEKTYGSSNWERLYDAILLPDEGLVLVGDVEGAGHDGKDAYVVRVDADGEVLWEEHFQGAQDDVAYTCTLFDNSTLLIGGVWGETQSNAWLAKFDFNGTLIWSKNDYLLDRFGEVRAVKIYDNKIYFYGNWSPLPFIENNTRKYQGVAQLNGDLINNVFEGGTNETHVSFTKLKDNRFYGLSLENNPLFVGPNGPRATIFGNEGGGYFIGFSHLIHGYRVTPGKIINSADTCLVVVGTIQDPAFSSGGANILLLKINDTTTSLETISTNPILSIGNFEESGYYVFPNPAADFLEIVLPTGVAVNNYAIYDLLGNQVIYNAFQNTLDLQSLSSGMYLLLLETKNGIRFTRIQKK